MLNCLPKECSTLLLILESAFNDGYVSVEKDVSWTPLIYNFNLLELVACVVSTAKTIWYQALGSLRTWFVILLSPLSI